jgi:hypothetical protein
VGEEGEGRRDLTKLGPALVVALAPSLLALTCGPAGPLPPDPEYCSDLSSGTVEEVALAPHDVDPFTAWQEWGGFRVVLGSQGADMFMFRAGARGTGELSCVEVDLELTDEITGEMVGRIVERVTTAQTTSGFRATDDMFVILEHSRFESLRARLTIGGATLERSLALRMSSSAETLPELVPPDTGPPPAWTLEHDRLSMRRGDRRTVVVMFPDPLASAETVTVTPVDAAIAAPVSGSVSVAAAAVRAELEVEAVAPGNTYLVVSTSDGLRRALRVDVSQL